MRSRWSQRVPPRLSAIGGVAAAASATSNGSKNWAVPVGIVQNFNLSHNRAFARFWELGSERSYHLGAHSGTGRLRTSSLPRPFLAPVMYSFYEDLLPPTIARVPRQRARPVNQWTGCQSAQREDSPGYENIYLHLASGPLPVSPAGLLVYMKDSNENTISSAYLEETYIPSHSIATDAQGVVIQEQVALQPERVVPVAVSTVQSVKLSSILTEDIAS